VESKGVPYTGDDRWDCMLNMDSRRTGAMGGPAAAAAAATAAACCCWCCCIGWCSSTGSMEPREDLAKVPKGATGVGSATVTATGACTGGTSMPREAGVMGTARPGAVTSSTGAGVKLVGATSKEGRGGEECAAAADCAACSWAWACGKTKCVCVCEGRRGGGGRREEGTGRGSQKAKKDKKDKWSARQRWH
jgi:hypothetical protein